MANRITRINRAYKEPHTQYKYFGFSPLAVSAYEKIERIKYSARAVATANEIMRMHIFFGTFDWKNSRAQQRDETYSYMVYVTPLYGYTYQISSIVNVCEKKFQCAAVPQIITAHRYINPRGCFPVSFRKLCTLNMQIRTPLIVHIYS